ncbi:MAG: DUF739 family protein [Gudongella sp.]|jgi:hypothetical protein|nr:DUF739 family protein [Gudongella sp.]
MFNYTLLNKRIIEKYETKTAFVKVLGMTERAFLLRMNGKAYFEQNEITKMIDLLDIPILEATSYFFTVGE